MKKKALGRGLGALIPEREKTESFREHISDLPIEQIKPSKFQPRSNFDQKRLDDLVNSIKEKGIVQPILVRKAADGYEIIAGERRWRAAKTAGLESITAIVKDVDDIDLLELSLIENIQREDLNPIEEAAAYQRFIDEFSYTQEEVSKVLGKERSTIANTLRLLSLPKTVQDYIVANSITAGHGRALLSLSNQKEQLRCCAVVVKKGLSVRETEQLVAKRLSGRKAAPAPVDSNISSVEDELRQRFGTRVKIVHGKKRGKIFIEYYSPDDLERILAILRNTQKNESSLDLT